MMVLPFDATEIAPPMFHLQINSKLLPLRLQVRSIFPSHGSKELKIAAWHLAVAMNFCVVRGQEHDEESKLQASE